MRYEARMEIINDANILELCMINAPKVGKLIKEEAIRG